MITVKRCKRKIKNTEKNHKEAMLDQIFIACSPATVQEKGAY
jgi:hypothetical protein